MEEFRRIAPGRGLRAGAVGSTAQTRPAAAMLEPLEGRRLMAAQVVDAWTFEDGDTGGWADGMSSTTPVGARTFLETAATTLNRTITLQVDDLPPHQQLTIAFDLFIVRGWDGDTGFWAPVGRSIGPDYWGFTGGTAGSQEVLYAEQTFSTLQEQPFNFTQSAGTPDEQDTLGYFHNDGGTNYPADMVYHIERTFDHSAASALFMFNGRSLSQGGGESWGLDNVQLSADVPEPAGICLVLSAVRFALNRPARPGNASTLTSVRRAADGDRRRRRPA